LNRHRQGPAKGHPTSLFRAPRNRLTPTLLRCRLELTAVSAICLLGLAIWFSKTEPLVAVATVCYRFSTSQPHPLQLRGRHSLFRSDFSVKRPLPLRFIASPRMEVTSRRSALLPSLARGRGTYCVSAFPVNRLRRPLLSTDSALSPLRLSPFRGAALLPPPRWVSTPLVDFVFRLSVRPGAPTAVAASLSRPRGAASTTAAFGVNRLR
jgi:hypothetical protein